MTDQTFRFKPETLKRCKHFELDARTEARFCGISSELFHFLYQTPKIEFSIYFRAGNTVLEFIRPDELCKELLDEVQIAMQRPRDGLSACILKKDRAAFDRVIEAVRVQKLTGLMRLLPNLDKKTLDLYGNLSSASQMIVAGGIDSEVAASVKASAAFLVSNQLDSAGAIDTLSRMINCDPTLYDHSATVAMIATVIATTHVKKPISPNHVQIIAQCALFHDVGKTCVPSAVLNKPGKFTPEEFEVMKTHTTLGHLDLEKAAAAGVPMPVEVRRVALEHHEKFQGGGYPLNRKGRLEDDPVNGIHLFTRIVTIADIYSALLMKRVYKEAFPPQDAIKIMASMSKDLDPDIFSAFLRAVVDSLNVQQRKLKDSGRLLELDASGQLQEIKRPA